MTLPGEKEILDILKQDTLLLYDFDEVIEFQVKKTAKDLFNKNNYDGYLILTNGKNVLKVEMINIHGSFNFYFEDHIECLDIVDCFSRGFESENRYHIYDVEDSNNLNIFCEDILLSLL